MLRHDDDGWQLKVRRMKVTVDVDCTPTEARAFLGLPDVTPIHDKYVKTMLDSFDGIASAE